MRRPDKDKRRKEALRLTELPMLAMSEEAIEKALSAKLTQQIAFWADGGEKYASREKIHEEMMKPEYAKDRKIMTNAIRRDTRSKIINGERHFLLHRGTHSTDKSYQESTDSVTYSKSVSTTPEHKMARSFADETYYHHGKTGHGVVHSVWVPESKISLALHHTDKVELDTSGLFDWKGGRNLASAGEKEVIIAPGNYQKAMSDHLKKNDPIQAVFDFHGIQINIEWPKGSTRHYTDGYKKEMSCSYGYIARTDGEDGEETDFYLGDCLESKRVFLIHQNDSQGGEDKVMLGFATPEDAKIAYLAHMDEKNFGSIREMSLDELKAQISKKPESLPHGEEKTDGIKYIVKSEPLAKELWGLSQESKDKIRPFHGWISPEGKFHQMQDSATHDDFLVSNKLPSGDKVNDTYKLGWIGTGHSGRMHVTGHPDVLSNPNHPAVQKAREMIAALPHEDFEEVGVLPSTGHGWDITKERAVKFGLHKPTSELAAFHKTEEEIRVKLAKLHDLMKRVKLEGHHTIPFAVKPGTTQKRSIEDKIRVLNHYLGDLYGKPPIKELTPKEHLKAHGIKKTEDDLIHLEHYSDQSREIIDPKFHGAGVSGQESKRKSDPGWVDRAYYYDAGTKPEASLANKPFKHTASLPKSKIYDLGKDPKNFSHNAVDEGGFHSHNVIEGRIKQAGYAGYRHSGSAMPNVVAVFDALKPHKVEEQHVMAKSDEDWLPSEEDHAAIGAITGQHESRFEALGRLGRMKGKFREDALNHLAQNTQIRTTDSGKREFLLHRGMSGKEYKNRVTGKSTIAHEERTSWTPKKEVAQQFSTVVGKHPASAWIHEDKIVAIPRAYGYPEDHPHTKEYEVIIDPHTSERHTGNISKSEEDFTHRGWISPSGEFEEIHPDEEHSSRFDTRSHKDVADQEKETYQNGWISVGHLWGANACVHPGVLNNPNHPAMKTLREMVGNWPGKKFRIERYGVAENRTSSVNPQHFAAHGTIPEESVVARFHKSEIFKGALQNLEKWSFGTVPPLVQRRIIAPDGKVHTVGSEEHSERLMQLAGKARPHKDGWIEVGRASYPTVIGHPDVLNDPHHPATKALANHIANEWRGDVDSLKVWHEPSTQDTEWFDIPRHAAEKGDFKKPSVVAEFHKALYDKDTGKLSLAPGHALRLRNVGFRQSERSQHLDAAVPERKTHIFALHPDKWEHTFNSLTGKDRHKISHYRPEVVPTHPDTLVLEMKHATAYMATGDKKHLENYKQSAKKLSEADLDAYHQPELLIPQKLTKEMYAAGSFKKPSGVAEFHKTEGDFKPTYIGHKYSIITAHNPLFPTKSVGGNQGLEEELKQAGYKYEHTVGMYGGTHEPGFLVHNADPKHIEKLGEKYGQESVIHSEAGKHKMVFTNGPKKGQFHSGAIEQQYMEPPEDNYTTLERNGNKHHFSMEFDFNKLEKTDGIFEKLLELKKGVARRLWPFNPQEDRPGEREEADLASWQAGETPDGQDYSFRDLAGATMSHGARERALHKLSGATKVRRAADGKREFLLHRGMSEEEHRKVVGPTHVGHEDSSSWTPSRQEAGVISGAYGGKKLASAWIHEDHITSIPKQYGELDPNAYMIADEEGYKPPKGPNPYAHEHEVIVTGGHKSELHQEKENKFRNLQTMISAKKPLSYLPGPSKWLEHYGLKDSFKKTEDDPCE